MQNRRCLRSETILRTLVETYIQDGEPVGSRLLSKRFPEHISSATIRNVLADLEEEDLLTQPHASAGRVPTERAFRWYVDRWIRPSVPDPETGAKLRVALIGMEQDPEAWLRHASRVLAEVMGGACIALPLHLAASRLLRLEFVPLPPRRIVAVWVSTTGDVEHQVMENIWDYDSAALVELGNFATSHYRGLSLDALRGKLLEALQDQADLARQLMSRLAGLMEAMTPPGGDPLLVVAGLGELGQHPEFGDVERFRELVRAFEEHQRLARLLNVFAESAADSVKLLLGTENPCLGGMPLATLIRTVELPTERAAFAVIAPIRLDYGRALNGFQWWSEEVARRNPMHDPSQNGRPGRA